MDDIVNFHKLLFVVHKTIFFNFTPRRSKLSDIFPGILKNPGPQSPTVPPLPAKEKNGIHSPSGHTSPTSGHSPTTSGYSQTTSGRSHTPTDQTTTTRSHSLTPTGRSQPPMSHSPKALNHSPKVSKPEPLPVNSSHATLTRQKPRPPQHSLPSPDYRLAATPSPDYTGRPPPPSAAPPRITPSPDYTGRPPPPSTAPPRHTPSPDYASSSGDAEGVLSETDKSVGLFSEPARQKYYFGEEDSEVPRAPARPRTAQVPPPPGFVSFSSWLCHLLLLQEAPRGRSSRSSSLSSHLSLSLSLSSQTMQVQGNTTLLLLWTS